MSSTLVMIKLALVQFNHKKLEPHRESSRGVRPNPKNPKGERPQVHPQSQVPDRNPWRKMTRMRMKTKTMKTMKTNRNWQIFLTRAQRKLQGNLCQTRTGQ